MKTAEIRRLDSRPVPDVSGEIRGFLCVRDEAERLPYVLDYHRGLGVHRFFIIDNGSDDGSREFAMEQPDCHVLLTTGNFFRENIAPPTWENAARNVYGQGYWCLSLDADELLVYPDCETVGLERLCAYLDRSGAEILHAPMLDMYPDTPLLETTYEPGRSFLDYCAYFDGVPGTERRLDGWIPPVQLISRARRRGFWVGRHRNTLPPVDTKVPLVRWKFGTAYTFSQHYISRGVLSELQGALLHFKFLCNFYKSTTEQVAENEGFREKALDERSAYIEALDNNPSLSLMCAESVRYTNSRQLVELGLMRSSVEYERHVGCAGVS